MTGDNTGQIVEPTGQGRGHITAIALNPDGTTLAVASSLGVWLYDMDSLEPVRRLSEGYVGALAWSPNGSQLAVLSGQFGGASATLQVQDVTSGRLLCALDLHAYGGVNSVAWSPDGTQLASGMSDNTVWVWDAASGGRLRALEGHTSISYTPQRGVLSIAWAPDGTRIASGNHDGTVEIWDSANGQRLHLLEGIEYGAWSVAWSPDGTQVASGGSDASLRVWDAASGRQLHVLRGDGGDVISVAWSPDGAQLASAAVDGRGVRVWDAITGHRVHVLERHAMSPSSVIWSPDGARIVSSGSDDTVRVWDAVSGKLVRMLADHANLPSANATLEPTRAATATMAPAPVTTIQGAAVAYTQDGRLYIRDLQQAAPPLLLDTCQDYDCLFQYLKWSPNGQYLLYYREDNGTSEIRLADRHGVVQTVASDPASLRPAAWSPDGRQIAFLRHAVRLMENESDQFPLEVWTVVVSASGAIGDAKSVGEFNIPAGCGGGGRSPSDELYEREGGPAYGFQMGKTEWTAQNILLYTLDCGNSGIGRFDMSAGAVLEPYAVPLRGLVLNQARDRWIAVTWDDRSTGPVNTKLATGDPTSIDTEIIPTSAPVELVYVGPVSGHIYYTARQRTGGADLSEQVGDSLDSPIFDFYESTLWVIRRDGSGEKLLWQAADHSFAGVAEAPDGSILFVRVENDTALYEAVQDETVALEDWVDYLPQRHIVRIPAPGGEPEPWLENAGNLAISSK